MPERKSSKESLKNMKKAVKKSALKAQQPSMAEKVAKNKLSRQKLLEGSNSKGVKAGIQTLRNKASSLIGKDRAMRIQPKKFGPKLGRQMTKFSLESILGKAGKGSFAVGPAGLPSAMIKAIRRQEKKSPFKPKFKKPKKL